MRCIESPNFQMQPIAGYRHWNDEAHGEARQRPGVRWPSTAFAVRGTRPERQRTGALQNLAEHLDDGSRWVHHDYGASFSTVAS
jgi:hypothetical protein